MCVCVCLFVCLCVFVCMCVICVPDHDMHVYTLLCVLACIYVVRMIPVYVCTYPVDVCMYVPCQCMSTYVWNNEVSIMLYLCVDVHVWLPIALIALLFPYMCKLSVIKFYARRKCLVKII